MFEKISTEAEKTKRKYSVYCSFLQIYNERIFDLLNPSHFIDTSGLGSAGLKLRFKNGTFAVDNLYTFECSTKNDVFDLFHFGLNNRIVAAHRLNHASSRSHTVLTLTVESVDLSNMAWTFFACFSKLLFCLTQPQKQEDYVVSKLQLVDLAGSERMTISEYDAKLTKECIEINKSLFTLRKVITTLTEMQTTGKTAYVPYRESKLTSLLKESIGGNSYSLMISALTPSDKFIEENVSTLNYSTKAAYIANKPIKNQDPKIRLISELKV